jgi:hypothetical protein
LGGRIWLVYLTLPVNPGELEPNFISYLFDLLVDTQAVGADPSMGSNHELDRLFGICNLLILQGSRSRQKPQKQGSGTKSVQKSSSGLTAPPSS